MMYKHLTINKIIIIIICLASTHLLLPASDEDTDTTTYRKLSLLEKTEAFLSNKPNDKDLSVYKVMLLNRQDQLCLTVFNDNKLQPDEAFAYTGQIRNLEDSIRKLCEYQPETLHKQGCRSLNIALQRSCRIYLCSLTKPVRFPRGSPYFT